MPAQSQHDVSVSESKKPLFEASTQFRHWRFSSEELAESRASLNQAAVQAIQLIRKNEPSSDDVSFLSAQEEQLLVKLYLAKITQLCGHFRFPEEVEATAQTYLKRFYLKNTVMDWHPKNVMLTALFLATKTTNHPISLEAYTNHIPKTSPSDVLDLEFLVAQSLGFEFAVWHAHRALWGICLDLQSLADAAPEDIKGAYSAAVPQVRASRLTDAEFIYTPAQVALACLSIASPSLASQWASAKKSDSVLPTLAKIKQLIARDGCEPEVDAVRAVDRRLKICTNPEKVVGSQAFLAKKAEQNARAEEKRAKKAEVTRRTTEEELDLFGSELTRQSVGEATDLEFDSDD